jgi:eukaryotic-like serine/threonine-protein kinase
MESSDRIGRPAPNFDLECTIAEDTSSFDRVQLEDYQGHWLMLVFYPRDFSFVCPTELTALSARHAELTDRECKVLGVSVDSIELHQEWLETPPANGGVGPLRFPLASDPDGHVARAYGVFSEEKRLALRGLFLIDPDGLLQYQVVHSLGIGRSVDEVLRVLDALRAGGLCPVSWTLGDGTIDPALSLEPGRVLGRYRLRRELGRGGFGFVFETWDLWLQRLVALKVLRPGTKADMAAMLREARAAAAISHPAICTIHAVDVEDGLPVIAMELLRGPTLAERIEEGPMPVAEAVAIARQVAAGLAASHDQGIAHGDLKPANVMLVEGGAKILDFGIARRIFQPDGTGEHVSMDEEGGEVVAISGTLAYMAPERLDGSPHTPPGDVFALGLLMVEMLSGERALNADNLLTLMHQIYMQDPTRFAQGLPSPLDDIVNGCLQRDPAERTGAAALAALL